MSTARQTVVMAAWLLTPVGTAVCAAADSPPDVVSLDQHLDRATLARYYHTDQGTRLVPAAWLASVASADGAGPFMRPDNLRRFGFLVDADGIDPGGVDPRNPFGWPLGFTVSDPTTTAGIAVAGFTCALCHTGEIDYRGKAVRIEGGQAMIDLPAFINGLFGAFAATANDPIRRARFLAAAIQAGYPAERMAGDFAAAAARFGAGGESAPQPKIVEAGHGRLDAVQGIANQVFGSDLMVPGNVRDLDAPVNFPYLWDIWRLSWLQYNGFLTREATARNIGEVLGSRATTHFVDPRSGAPNPQPLRWQTSIQLGNLLWMEKTLESLRAPAWPAAVLGPIDPARVTRGRRLFTADCAGCHGIKTLPDGAWDVSVVSLQHIGTDPGQALHWAARAYDARKLGLSEQAPAVDLSIAINAIRKQLYVENGTPPAEQEKDTAFEAPCGYKARPLIGVWATPPFLHNGSVRTVFELLSDTRAARFRFGSREYDPVHLGYTQDQAEGSMILDTAIPGNGNAGHWFTDEASRPGRIGPKLADADKYAIIEFLKAASYDDYPSERRARMARLPCQGDKTWTRKMPESTAAAQRAGAS